MARMGKDAMLLFFIFHPAGSEGQQGADREMVRTSIVRVYIKRHSVVLHHSEQLSLTFDPWPREQFHKDYESVQQLLQSLPRKLTHDVMVG